MADDKPTVYIETTVVSYLTARPTNDLVRQAHQVSTQRWWNDCRSGFRLYCSELVRAEASQGDPDAAALRMAVLDELPLLELTDSATALADQFLAAGALPLKARLDAMHLAICAVNGIDYLLTWNCRHLANGLLRSKIDTCCVDAGFEPPIICTAIELMEVPDAE